MNFKEYFSETTLRQYAPVLLRLSLSGVFVWFGTSQLLDAGSWTGFVPEFVPRLSGISAVSLVHVNGGFEVIAGSLLAIGMFPRLLALLLSLHLLGITASIGLTALGIRDLGLALAALAVAMQGADAWSLASAAEPPPDSSR